MKYCPVLVLLAMFLAGPQAVYAQAAPGFGFGMRLQTLQFQQPSFQGFSFRGQAFQGQNTQAIQIPRITFPAFNSAEVRRQRLAAGTAVPEALTPSESKVRPVPPTQSVDPRWVEPVLVRRDQDIFSLPNFPQTATTTWSPYVSRSGVDAYSQQVFQNRPSPERTAKLERFRTETFGPPATTDLESQRATRWALKPAPAQSERPAIRSATAESAFASEFRTASQAGRDSAKAAVVR